jgi:hypothetical protein
MSYENLKLTKQNFTVDQGYFYSFDQDQDSLIAKTDDGNTSFSYPFDTLMTKEVLSAEFDGVYFWSLEDPGATNIIIRRWLIDNYICKLQKTFNFVGGGSHEYDSEAFSVEHYHTTLNGVTVSGSSTLYLNKYSDHNSMNFTTTSGDPLTLHIGPNSNGEEEDVEVSTTISGGVTISGTTQYGYASGDKVNYYTHIWMFNNYNGVISAGALYKFDAYTGDYLTKYESGTYKDVSAATFYNVNSFTEYGNVDTLAYVKSTNTLFIDISQGTLPHYGSMVMDNVKMDEATLIKVYDMVMDDQNVYRLQKGATYYEDDYTWANHNYQLSSLDSFVTSISLAAYPAIIAANQVSTSDIIAIVKDQFLQPIVARLVTFSDDNTIGVIIGSPDNTDADGKAQVVYKSGTDATEVKITAVVEQV